MLNYVETVKELVKEKLRKKEQRILAKMEKAAEENN